MLQAMLDANLCVRVLRDRPAHVGRRFSAEADALAISTVVLFELRYGADKSDRPSHHHELVRRFVARLEILPFDERASAHAADIRANLTGRGCVMGAYDMLIAGHARGLGLKLITGNLGEFSRVDGLRCEDWLDA